MVRKLGAGPGRGRRRRRHRLGQIEHVGSGAAGFGGGASAARLGGLESPAWRRCRLWLLAAGGGARRWRRAGCGGGANGCGGAVGGGFGGGGSGGLAGLPASSSAMIRRMEARISSIEGSWAFADWVIAEFPSALAIALLCSPIRRSVRQTAQIVACNLVIRQRDGVAVEAQEP